MRRYPRRIARRALASGLIVIGVGAVLAAAGACSSGRHAGDASASTDTQSSAEPPALEVTAPTLDFEAAATNAGTETYSLTIDVEASECWRRSPARGSGEADRPKTASPVRRTWTCLRARETKAA